MRADNRLEQVAEEVLIFAPYAISISQLSEMIKGSRSSIYRVFKGSKRLKQMVKEILGSKAQEAPPTLTEIKKKIISIPKSKRKKSVSEDKEVSQLKISDIKGDREIERVVEVKVLRTTFQFHKTHHKPHQRIEKSLEICRLIIKGYTVIEACEIYELGKSTFHYWVRTFPDVKAMYDQAKNIFNAYREDEFLFRSYEALERKLKPQVITEINRIGMPDKNGKIITHTVIEKTYMREPCVKAILKVLTTLCSDTFGTERERAKAAKNNNPDVIDYSLRLKSTEELEEELKRLDAELKTA